jgi:hypothetical protein
MRAWIAVALLGLCGVASAQTTSAQCVATEIAASNDKKGIDGKLERFKAKLVKPPFASWDTFQQVGEQTLTLEKGKAAPGKLQHGAVTLLYKDKLVTSGAKARIRVGIDLDGKDGKRIVSTVIVVDSGDGVLIAADSHQAGIYVLGLTCTAQ